MNSTANRTAGIVVALALAAVGCSSSTGTSARFTPDPGATEAPSAELAPYYTQRIRWRDCEKGFECTTVQVPLDYAKPSRERIEIAVNRLPATEDDRIGSVLLNPGGPGMSGLEVARQIAPIFDIQVRKRFDVVGFDPRGVGRSAPIRCLDPEDWNDDSSFVDTTTSAKQAKASWRLLARKCGKKSGRLLPHVGTENAARDMDILRAVLGDRDLTYVGWSYGSELGTTYADLFPGKVRALVLDGAVDPTLNPLEFGVAQAKGFEVALRAFVADCLTAADCPLKARTVDGAIEEIAELRRRADERPLTNSAESHRTVSGSGVLAGIGASLYARQMWPLLRKALSQAMNEGDGTLLQEAAEELIGRRPDGTWSNHVEAGAAIRCVDWPRIDRAAAENAARRAEQEAPTFGTDLEWAWVRCTSWPVPAPDSQRRAPRAEGSAPILVIGTQRDPATPYGWATALADQLENATLLSYGGDGHGAYLMAGSNCIDDLVDRYLIDTQLPKAGTRCPGIEGE